MIKLFDININQPADILIRDTAKGDLLISEIGEGEFVGETISGKVLPMGIGLTYTPSEGFNMINMPVILEMDDGTRLLMELNAYLELSPEQESRFIAGLEVPPDAYYYKGTVRFDVGEPKYKWLEKKLFVCNGEIDSWNALKFTVYQM